MPILEAIVALWASLLAFWETLTDEQRQVVLNLVSSAFEAMLGDYYDWFKAGAGAAA